MDYFAFGVSTVAGFTALLTFLSSVFFTSGVVPGFTGELTGDPVGEATGVAAGVDGLAVATGAGVAAGLFGTSVFVSHALITATEAAKTDDKINEFLILDLLFCAS